jgi:hypothetical protein
VLGNLIHRDLWDRKETVVLVWVRSNFLGEKLKAPTQKQTTNQLSSGEISLLQAWLGVVLLETHNSYDHWVMAKLSLN